MCASVSHQIFIAFLLDGDKEYDNGGGGGGGYGDDRATAIGDDLH